MIKNITAYVCDKLIFALVISAFGFYASQVWEVHQIKIQLTRDIPIKISDLYIEYRLALKNAPSREESHIDESKKNIIKISEAIIVLSEYMYSLSTKECNSTKFIKQIKNVKTAIEMEKVDNANWNSIIALEENLTKLDENFPSFIACLKKQMIKTSTIEWS